MFPWLWFWAPQFHFPWSGSVAQRIEPNTNWFFDAIDAPAGGDPAQHARMAARLRRLLGEQAA